MNRECPDFLDADSSRVDLLEVAFGVGGDELGKGGFASARRAIKDNAGQAVGFEHTAQELAGPRKCCCPTNSSSVRGRMRTAKGAALLRFFWRESWKRSMGK